MAKYFELRKPATNGSLSADMMRHLHARQHLGRAVVICDNPAVTLSAARKQWMKISRTVQNRRAGTLNADKILKYTHAVSHMQRMAFTAKQPHDEHEADVYFLHPDSMQRLPAQCLTVYLTTDLANDQPGDVLAQMADDGLVVDYRHAVDWVALEAQAKTVLNSRVLITWRELTDFLTSYQIDALNLSDASVDVEAMEEALDILLGAHGKFLQVASDFQRALELARPLRLTKEVRRRYDAAILLAHRVQALSPGAFTQSFLETYDEDDTYFLYDRGRERTRRYYWFSSNRLIAREKAASLSDNFSLIA